MKKIAEGIFYIGADDAQLDLFESQYPLEEGMSYNSYLVEGEKIAVMDTVDAAVASQWQDNLLEALAGRTPDYLVVHHMEPDHSGLIEWMVRKWPDVQIVASAKAISFLGQFFEGFQCRSLAVKEGDTIDLGGRSLRFFMAPMVHWPEVMVSLDSASSAIFSADAFGKFGALSACGFWGEEDGDWACEARRYYFNICGKYGLPVQTLLKKVSALNLSMICPLHGPVLRENLGYYTGLYDIWSRYDVESEGVFIAYASIHGGTALAARRLSEMLSDKGVKVVVTDLSRCDMAEAVEDAFRYGKTVLAAASYDGGVFPPMAVFLHHLCDKAWQKRTVGIIENGTWAPSAARVIKDKLSAMKEITVLEPVVSIRSRLKTSDMGALEALAAALAQ